MERADFLVFLTFLGILFLVWLAVTVPLALLVEVTTSLHGTLALQVVELSIALPLIVGFVVWGFWSTRTTRL